MKDSKGKAIPAWARYIQALGATTAFAGHKVNGEYVPFAIHCKEEAVVQFTPIDNASTVTMTLAAGHHPLACKSITTSDVAIHLLFAYRPEIAAANS